MPLVDFFSRGGALKSSWYGDCLPYPNESEEDMTDKVWFVTGASRGLGRSVIEQALGAGHNVVGTARRIDALSEFEQSYPGRFLALPLDVTDAARAQSAIGETVWAFGRLDVVVNNAGIAPAGAFVDQPPEEWKEVFAVNVTAPAALCRAAGPLLLAQRSGKVINIASTSGISGKPLLVSYSASKGAVIQFTKALAAEWASDNVQVNVIAPGAFETRAQQVVLESPDLRLRRTRRIPARRMAMPAEIGPLVCLLASPSTTFITGSVFVIDGGEVAKL
jgi:2-deoxy-D-gluconate 3-dehydrogenase